MKYRVTIRFERTQDIVVDASSKDEAIELINDGEFEDSNIVHTEDDYVQIVGASKE